MYSNTQKRCSSARTRVHTVQALADGMLGAGRKSRKEHRIDLEHDLPTNYDKRYKPVILQQAFELKKKGLINIWPAAGGRKAVAAIISEEAIEAGLPIVNAYAKSVGEEPLDGTIREIITGKRSEKKPALTSEELRKFARMHKEAEGS